MKQNNKYQKLELTWVGKGEEPQLEPRILIENPEYSYGDKDSQNMIIHGDNLLALKALEQEYAGKVKCIYIDPPYNTGSAFEHYDDGIEHSIWLNLISARLKILWSLLDSNLGSIWISIDDYEMPYLRVVLDEICGRNNFLACNVWQKRYSRENREAIGDVHEYILVYVKSPQKFKAIRNKIPPTEKQLSVYKNPNNDPNGAWRPIPMTAQEGHATASQYYEVVTPSGKVHLPPIGRCWGVSEETYKKLLAVGRIYFGKNNDSQPNVIRYLSEIEGFAPWTWWPNEEVGHTDEAKKEIHGLFGKDKAFDTPKPERLLERILHIASDKNDLVLDSFLGSGTTSAVAHKMGRRYIGIELGNHAYSLCAPRMQNVVDGEQGGISKAVNWQGGGGFKFYELAPSLLNQDEYGNWIISKEYNPDMLAAAMAKQENFVYQPDSAVYWKQGKSTEKDFIFTTTQFVSGEMLDKLHNELATDETLLICATSFAKGLETRYSNIKLRKIPLMLLGRCEFGKDDYSLNIINLPTVDDDSEDDEIIEDSVDNACNNNTNELF